MSQYSKRAVILLTLIGVISIIGLSLMVRSPAATTQSREEQIGEPTLAPTGTLLLTPMSTQERGDWQAAYVFGEPQIVLRSPTSLAIVQWLPDGQRILLVEGGPGGSAFYLVKTYDLLTQESTDYGQFGPMNPKVAWLEDVQKAVYLGSDGEKTPLMIAGKDANSRITPIAEVARMMDARGNLIVALDADKVHEPVAFDGEGVPQAIPVVDLREYGIASEWQFMTMKLHPSEPKVAIFSESGFVIFDMQRDEVHSFDLGEDRSESLYGKRWAMDAKWSPDGKQLALLVHVGSPPTQLSKVFILTPESGKLTELPTSLGHVFDIQWAPNGQQLLVGGINNASDNGEIMLVDIISQQHIKIEQLSKNYTYGEIGMGMQWSSDGSELLTRCRLDSQSDETAICLTEVKIGK